mgnify:CR=1 FL=1
MEWWGWLVLVFFLMLLLEAVICAGCPYAVHKDEEDKAAAAAAASGERDGIIHGPGRDDGYDLPSGGGGGGGGAQQQGPFAAAVKPSGVQDLGLSKYAPQRDNERGTQQPAVPLQGEGNNNAAFGNDGEYGGGGGNFQGGASPWKGAGTSTNNNIDEEMRAIDIGAASGSKQKRATFAQDDFDEEAPPLRNDSILSDSMMPLPHGSIPVTRDPLREILSPDHVPEGADANDADALVLRASMLPPSAAPVSSRSDDLLSNSL